MDGENIRQILRILVDLLALIAALAPPIVASRGKGYRGFWVGMMIIASIPVVIAYSMFDPQQTKVQLLAKGIESPADTAYDVLLSGIILVSFCFAFGSLLAACFYRSPSSHSQ
jgi:hypothetical protein